MSEDEGQSGLPGIPGSDEPPLAGIPGAEEYAHGTPSVPAEDEPAPAALAADPGQTALAADPGQTALAADPAQPALAADPAQPALATGPAGLGQVAPADREPLNVGQLVSLILAIVAIVILALLLIGFVVESLHPHAGAGASRGSYIASGVIDLLLLLGAVAWARHAEHRLHVSRRHPAALAAHAGAGSTAAAGTPGARRRRGRRYSPGSALFTTILFAVIAVGLVLVGISNVNGANRSDYTQHHGTPATGTVTNVDNIQSCGRYSCDYTSEITVSLSPPVDGVSQTVVHYPDYSPVSNGDQVQILVDPKEPGYAELPGHTRYATSSWVGAFVGALVCLALAGAFLRLYLGLRRAKREHPPSGVIASPAPG